jgi:hypothetical protein
LIFWGEITEGENFKLENCSFYELNLLTVTESNLGGMIVVYGSNPSALDSPVGMIEIENCVFKCCSTKGVGGAVVLMGTTAKFLYCKFMNCTSERYGGALYVLFRKSYTFSQCMFLNCSTTLSSGCGGAIYVMDNLTNTVLNNENPIMLVDHCFFQNNSAPFHGDDIYLNDSEDHFDSYLDPLTTSMFIHSLSHTIRENNEPDLVYSLNSPYVHNLLLPYKFNTDVYINKENEDVENCGCEHYPCRTIEYSLEMFNLFFFLIFFFF